LPESKQKRRPGGMIAAGAAAVAALFAFAALGGVGVGQSAIGMAQYKAPKIQICHKAGPNGKRVTLKVSANAWPAHQRHGDTLGACGPAAAGAQKGNGKGNGQGKGNGNAGAPTQGSSGAAKGNGKGKGNGQK
jgi:hypothetical protein